MEGVAGDVYSWSGSNDSPKLTAPPSLPKRSNDYSQPQEETIVFTPVLSTFPHALPKSADTAEAYYGNLSLPGLLQTIYE